MSVPKKAQNSEHEMAVTRVVCLDIRLDPSWVYMLVKTRVHDLDHEMAVTKVACSDMEMDCAKENWTGLWRGSHLGTLLDRTTVAA